MMTQGDHASNNPGGKGRIGLVVATEQEAVKAGVERIVTEQTGRGRAFLEHVQPVLAGEDAITGLEDKFTDGGGEALGGTLA
jgi:hypothetical protein